MCRFVAHISAEPAACLEAACSCPGRQGKHSCLRVIPALEPLRAV
jgi:hypothetical protein